MIKMLNRRQEKLLLLLSRFDYLTLNQFQKLLDLKSYNNTYRVIKQMEPFMSVFKEEGVNVYYLNKNGREYVNSNKVRAKLSTVNHYLMRNDLFIHLGKPYTWENEVELSYEDDKTKITAIADAHYTSISYPDHKHHIIEIDHTQKASKNETKIEKYKRLIELGVFNGMPRLIWVTTTPYRQKKLRELCKGLDALVYLKEDLR